MRGAKCTAMIFLVLTLFASWSAFRAYADTSETVSGSFQFTFVSQAYGTSVYTISYHYPKTVTTNSNLTITATVTINELTGYKVYLIDYGLTATVFSNGIALMGRVLGGNNNKYLYPGSHWGPLNITIPINSSDFDLSPGKSVEANISLQFIGDVWVNLPVNPYHYTDSNSSNIGSLSIASGTQPTPSYVYILPLGVIVLAGVVVTWIYYRKKSKRTIIHNQRIIEYENDHLDKQSASL